MIMSLLVFLVAHAEAALSTSSALEILTQPKETRVLSAREKGRETYPTLVKIAFADQYSIPMRWKALTLAAQINPEGVKGDLQRALRSKEWFLRNAALTAIKSVRPELLNDVIPKLIKDKALVVRSSAVSALDPRLEPKLRTLLWSELNANYNFRKGQSLWIRGQIIEKLAEHPTKKEFAAFAIALRSADTTLHAPAIAALEKITQRQFAKGKATATERRNFWLEYVRQNP